MSKKLYIYESVDGLTTMYHDGGALLILTDRDPQAELEAADDWTERHKAPKLGDPDRVIEVADTEENSVLIFPDAGCC